MDFSSPKMDSSGPKNGPKWILLVPELTLLVPKWTLLVPNGLFQAQNGLFQAQNGLFQSLNSPKMDSSVPLKAQSNTSDVFGNNIFSQNFQSEKIFLHRISFFLTFDNTNMTTKYHFFPLF